VIVVAFAEETASAPVCLYQHSVIVGLGLLAGDCVGGYMRGDPRTLRFHQTLPSRALDNLPLLKVGPLRLFAVQQRGCDPNLVGNGDSGKGRHRKPS
jgi:hypothetical protein